MQIKSAASVLSVCILSACSSPPELSVPQGDFVDANPATPSFASETKIYPPAPSRAPVNTAAVPVKPKQERVTLIATAAKSGSHPEAKSAPNSALVKSPVGKPVELKGFSTPVVTAPLNKGATGKNPFDGSAASPAKPILKPVVTKPVFISPPPKVWTALKGQTLKDAFMRWAQTENCGIGDKWSVKWDTDTNYPVDSTLTFTGPFEEVTAKLFSLYNAADRPLQVDGYKSQCLVVISDKK